MPKYYVESGSLRVCLNASNATEAAKLAMSRDKPETLGMLIKISEHGFDSTHPDDGFLLVPDILYEMGLVDDPGPMKQEFLDQLYGDKEC